MRCFWWLRKLSAFARPAGETRWIRALAPLEWVSLALPGAMPAVSVTTRWGLRLLQTRATSAGGVFMLTHARAGVDTEVESSALSSWSPAAQGGAVAAERVGVGFRESRFFFSATGSSFSEVRASSRT